MLSQQQRRIFSIDNKYQARIVLLAFFPTLTICLFLVVLVILVQLNLASQSQALLGVVVFIFSSLFVLALIRAFVLSHNLVGPFPRIIRELDEVIAGRSNKVISARPDDDLAKELLARVNILIQNYLENKK